MRSALLFAGACLFCLSQAGLADSGFLKLSKPGSDYSSFMGDRTACLNAAKHARFETAQNGGVPFVVNYSFEAFVGCMKSKGYQLDANGYRAAWYHNDYDRHYILRPDKPVHS